MNPLRRRLAHRLPLLALPALSPFAGAPLRAFAQANPEPDLDTLWPALLSVRSLFPDTTTQGEKIRFPESYATGTVISPDGWMVTISAAFDPPLGLTAALAGTPTVTAYTERGLGYRARLVGRDPHTMLALLKIDAPAPLPFIAPSPSPTPVRLGERVLALGRPGWSRKADPMVVDGVISLKPAATSSGHALMQSTCPLGKGMGGGVLLRARTGEVLGFNVAMLALGNERVGNGGVTLALDDWLRIEPALRSLGRVPRGAIGVNVEQITSEVSATSPASWRGAADVERFTGIRVVSVRADGPAQRAGVLAGDLIMHVEGKPVETTDALFRRVWEKRPGDVIELGLLRAGERVKVRVTAEALPN